MTTFARLRRRSWSDTGSAMVEVAVVLPVMMSLLVGATDFARVAYDAISIMNAARAGAQYGAHDLGNAADTGGMETTALKAAPNITGMTAVASKSCQCAQDDGTGTPWPTASCTAPAATACLVGSHRVVSVTVTTTKTFATIARYPGIPSSLTFSRSATMRVTE